MVFQRYYRSKLTSEEGNMILSVELQDEMTDDVDRWSNQLLEVDDETQHTTEGERKGTDSEEG